jgi:hypothetical protein
MKRQKKLLQEMSDIAHALITTIYITDFTVHDTQFIRETEGKKPFFWLVYGSGTHICETDNEERINIFLQNLDYFEQYSHGGFCMYQYDADKLSPVFPRIARVLLCGELTKLEKINH